MTSPFGLLRKRAVTDKMKDMATSKMALVGPEVN